MSSVVIFPGYRFSRGPENVGETCQHPLISQTQVTWPCLSHDLRIFLSEETRLQLSSIAFTLILCFPNQLCMQNLLEYASDVTCHIWHSCVDTQHVCNTFVTQFMHTEEIITVFCNSNTYVSLLLVS